MASSSLSPLIRFFHCNTSRRVFHYESMERDRDDDEDDDDDVDTLTRRRTSCQPALESGCISITLSVVTVSGREKGRDFSPGQQ